MNIIIEQESCKCAFCKWRTDLRCDAFPKQIPIDILSGETIHNKIDQRQKGKNIFKKVEFA
jgi:hypothetical protein